MKATLLPLVVLVAPVARTTTPPVAPWLNWTLPPAERAAALVKELTLDEKIAQLITDAPSIPRLNVSAYMWRNNVLHGLVDNGPSTMFPQAIGLAATWSRSLLRRAARVMADEQRAKHNAAVRASGGDSPMNYGLDLWGPNINMFVHPRWGRGQETYGEDPMLTSALAVAFIEGLQARCDAGYLETIATPKHFDAYTIDKEPPRLEFMANITERDLRQYYFAAWERVVRESSPGSIMCSYNGIQTSIRNGGSGAAVDVKAPMCASPLIQSVLRDELGFDGYVVTDSGALDFMITKFHSAANDSDAAAQAMAVGVDLNSGSVYKSGLPDAVADGRVDETQIDVALNRLFAARVSLGLFDPPSRVPFTTLSTDIVDSSEHRAVALETARASVVLLRNQNGLLPLDMARVRRVAAIGPAANDTWRMVGNYYGCSNSSWGPLDAACNITTPLSALEAAVSATTPAVTVEYAMGCDQESNSTDGFAKAKALASEADVTVLFLGLRNCEGGQGRGGPRCESEGHDRPDLSLPGAQHALAKMLVDETDTPVVLVLLNGGPVAIEWEAQNVPAILETFYGGALGGQAIVDVLMGAANPSGRMPYTVPTSIDQVPDETDMRLTTAPGRTYRYISQTPLYAFGFGLSYTTFNYSGAEVSPATLGATAAPEEPVSVCFSVANTGERGGGDVVQVYAAFASGDRKKEPDIPLRSLVAFETVEPLEAGEARNACVSFTARDLRLWDPNSERLALRPGDYKLYVGGTGPGAQGAYVPESAVQSPLELAFTITE